MPLNIGGPHLTLSQWPVCILQAILSLPLLFKGIKLTSVLNCVPLESSFLLISGSDGKHILYKYLLWERSRFWSHLPIHPSSVTHSSMLPLWTLHSCWIPSYSLDTSDFPTGWTVLPKAQVPILFTLSSVSIPLRNVFWVTEYLISQPLSSPYIFLNWKFLVLKIP